LFLLHDRINEDMIALELDRIGLCRPQYDDLVAHDWWLYGYENIQAGTADEMVVVSCSPHLYNSYHTRHDRIGPHAFMIQMHACPLIHDVVVSDRRFSVMYDSDHYPDEIHKIHQILEMTTA